MYLMILPKELGKDFTVIMSAKLTLWSVSYTDILRPFGDILAAVIQLDDTALLLGLRMAAAVEIGFEHATLRL